MQKYLNKLPSICLWTVALFSGCLHAQDFRVGIVDVDRILRDSNVSKVATLRLESEFLRRQKDLEDASTAFKMAADKFEKDVPTLSESQRLTRQKTLFDQDRELKRRQREFQEDLSVRKNEENQILIERTGRAVKQVAETEKYDLILQDAAYFNPKHNITEKVIKILNSPNFK